MLGARLGARDAEWKRRTLGDPEPCMMIGFPKVGIRVDRQCCPRHVGGLLGLSLRKEEGKLG